MLLKGVGHYDLSVLSMSVIGLEKRLDRVMSGWLELYPDFFGDFWRQKLTLERP